MTENDGWTIVARGPAGDYLATPKIKDRREAILTAYAMLNYSNVEHIYGYGPTGLEVISLQTIRREGAL